MDVQQQNSGEEEAAKKAAALEEKQEKYAEIIRVLWRHENDLMNARFGWFTTIQGLLFTALGFAWKTTPLDKTVVVVISVLGAIVAGMIVLILRIGFDAGTKLLTAWDKHVGVYDGPPLTGKPRIKRKDGGYKTFWLTEWEVIPYAFLIGWLIVIAYTLFVKPGNDAWITA